MDRFFSFMSLNNHNTRAHKVRSILFPNFVTIDSKIAKMWNHFFLTIFGIWNPPPKNQIENLHFYRPNFKSYSSFCNLNGVNPLKTDDGVDVWSTQKKKKNSGWKTTLKFYRICSCVWLWVCHRCIFRYIDLKLYYYA